MNKSESKYFNTALRMDEALVELLNQKPFEFHHGQGDMRSGGREPLHLLSAL